MTEAHQVPKTPIERELEQTETRPHRTGPNVDNGLVAGLVTVDPDTAEGKAAAATRQGNASSEIEHDNGIVEVTEGAMEPHNETPATGGMADPDAAAVDEASRKAKELDPTTIANEPKDIKADPKADVQ